MCFSFFKCKNTRNSKYYQKKVAIINDFSHFSLQYGVFLRLLRGAKVDFSTCFVETLDTFYPFCPMS